MTDLAQDIFHRADTSGSKTLSRDEIKKMFKELQMSISKKELNDLIARYDKDKSGEISFDEFKEMITELLRKQELVPLFKQYAKEYQANVYDAPAMTLNELVNFMRKEQKQETSIRNLLTLSDNFKGKDPDEPCISFDDFVAIIFSMRNIILNPEHSYVYQVINAIL
jgi:Ca2+-binding protein (EF-Hand superfamily)